MSANPIDDNSTPKTTGSLEELFRHHLGEEAAMPTRPMVWDQIDNSLLVRQNEIYRRRLVATRWVAAASLLLATLAGTGWWAGRDALLGGSGTVATSGQPAATRAGVPVATGAASRRTTRQPDGRNVAAGQATSAGAGMAAAGAGSAATGIGYSSPNKGTVAANSAPRYSGFGAASGHTGFARPMLTNGSAGTSSAGSTAARTAVANVEAPTVAARNAQTALTMPNGTSATNSPAALASNGISSGAMAASNGLADGGAAALGSTGAADAAMASSAAPTQVSLLATRPAALSLNGPAALPNGLATLTLEETPAAKATHNWHYGASYAVGAFNPNVNFSRAGIEHEYDYNPALGPDSPKLTEAAAAQYREHLRPGFSQRIALLATRRLSGRWSVSTGLEFGQATARSASTAAFVGEQLYDLGSFTNGPLRTTDFRYTMGSIPVEVRYANSVKKGWSIYGRLGGVVSALLGVRSEVEGDPEATKTYSIFSAGMPYRRVLGSVRGGAGAQYRPAAGSWSFTLGPVAEISAVSLNAHPAQDFLHESRAYGFGVEAGVEFGR